MTRGGMPSSIFDQANLAVGSFFLYGDVEPRIEDIVRGFNLTVLGWRDVPVREDALGKAAPRSRPRFRQLLLDTAEAGSAEKEPALYLARRALEKALAKNVYACSLSSRTIVYKGMLIAPFLDEFYPDLKDGDFESAFCMFHQRFSTNTLPDWTLAQPFRSLAHNGEINTRQVNRNWMTSLEYEVGHEVFGDKADLLRPLVSFDESDSASLDRIVELLILSGRPPEEAISMCIPPPWESPDLGPEEKAFFEYNSLLMKPWDGPAAVTF